MFYHSVINHNKLIGTIVSAFYSSDLNVVYGDRDRDAMDLKGNHNNDRAFFDLVLI